MSTFTHMSPAGTWSKPVLVLVHTAILYVIKTRIYLLKAEVVFKRPTQSLWS